MAYLVNAMTKTYICSRETKSYIFIVKHDLRLKCSWRPNHSLIIMTMEMMMMMLTKVLMRIQQLQVSCKFAVTLVAWRAFWTHPENAFIIRLLLLLIRFYEQSRGEIVQGKIISIVVYFTSQGACTPLSKVYHQTGRLLFNGWSGLLIGVCLLKAWLLLLYCC